MNSGLGGLAMGSSSELEERARAARVSGQRQNERGRGKWGVRGLVEGVGVPVWSWVVTWARRSRRACARSAQASG
jgi:hypothetical protein